MTKLKDERQSFRVMTEAQLVKELAKERQALALDKMSRVFGRLKNHRSIRERRRRIARLATFLTESVAKKLGGKET